MDGLADGFALQRNLQNLQPLSALLFLLFLMVSYKFSRAKSSLSISKLSTNQLDTMVSFVVVLLAVLALLLALEPVSPAVMAILFGGFVVYAFVNSVAASVPSSTTAIDASVVAAHSSTTPVVAAPSSTTTVVAAPSSTTPVLAAAISSKPKVNFNIKSSFSGRTARGVLPASGLKSRDAAPTRSGSVGGVFGPGLASSARASSASRPTTRPPTRTSVSSADASARDGKSDGHVYMPSYLASLRTSASGSRLQVLHLDASLSAPRVLSAPGPDGLDAVTGTSDLAPGLSGTGSSESVTSVQAPVSESLPRGVRGLGLLFGPFSESRASDLGRAFRSLGPWTVGPLVSNVPATGSTSTPGALAGVDSDSENEDDETPRASVLNKFVNVPASPPLASASASKSRKPSASRPRPRPRPVLPAFPTDWNLRAPIRDYSLSRPRTPEHSLPRPPAGFVCGGFRHVERPELCKSSPLPLATPATPPVDGPAKLDHCHDALPPSETNSVSVGGNEVSTKDAERVMCSSSLQTEDLPSPSVDQDVSNEEKEVSDDVSNEEQDGSNNVSIEEQEGSDDADPDSSFDDVLESTATDDTSESAATDETSIELLNSPPASGALLVSESPIAEDLNDLVMLFERMSIDSESLLTDAADLVGAVEDASHAIGSLASTEPTANDDLVMLLERMSIDSESPASPTSRDDLEDVVLMLERSTLQDASSLDNAQEDSMEVDEPTAFEAVDSIMDVDCPDCVMLETVDVDMDMTPAKTSKRMSDDVLAGPSKRARRLKPSLGGKRRVSSAAKMIRSDLRHWRVVKTLHAHFASCAWHSKMSCQARFETHLAC
ncbi:hypothetical protein IE81DRAFT_100752 [Ceraceosorus guamensis]|uniref:Uncharacterized protein n=1 Tax=Ceraceosorus guamensis TaxID=1522189 RepID=A0A316W3N9_9BASI|nr:hypothetical protein IE81DRAFT_100752 [Ceraceosorus guamensis]PWN43231.1 hypothetical protein IE81DRAFT_100752 [Ceraceosorus guamensis]